MDGVTTMVANILTGPEAQKIRSFTFGGKHFGAGAFYNIRSLIEGGFIKVIYESERNGSAEYEYATNTLFVGFPQAFDLGQKALVAHEAVHAVYDLVKMKMSVADNESIAYIVQCQFARAGGLVDRLTSSTRQRDKVFEVAWDIAGRVLQGYSPTADECNKMREAVSQHPFYSANASSMIKSDG